jgi:putative mRNA 3-end processing factor
MHQLVDFTSSGLYCPIADVFIDPWKPVDRAIITHAHADHARIGNMKYIAHHDTIPMLRHRLGMYIDTTAMDYNKQMNINGVNISLHPAGHIIGSAQVRLEYKGEVWVVSGDYKLDNDGLSQPFESVKCDVFITESTFGLPVFKWRNQQEIYNEINCWWSENIETGKNSVLLGYALGKAQRLLCNIDRSIGEIYAHGAIENINQVLRANGVNIPPVNIIDQTFDTSKIHNALILAPPSSLHTPWIEKFNPCSIAIASGWMALRAARRNKNIDRGFVLSDHADWTQLQHAVSECGAKTVFVTHGYYSSFSRWMDEQGIISKAVQTKFYGDLSEIRENIIEGRNQYK